MMTSPDLDRVAEAWHQVNDWRNDDQHFPVPSTDFTHDLVHFIDVLLEATKDLISECAYGVPRVLIDRDGHIVGDPR